ncbi:hypothetical protein ACTHGU_21555 [Chitinophagaceae bacterium MMS25-I14]
MKRRHTALLVLLLPAVQSFAQDYDKPCFPVKETTGSKGGSYFIDLKDPQTIKKYEGIFKKHNYTFTPETLQDVLEQALEKSNPDLAKDITFSADETQLHIDVKKGSQKKFFEFDCTTFNSVRKLEDLLMKTEKQEE